MTIREMLEKLFAEVSDIGKEVVIYNATTGETFEITKIIYHSSQHQLDIEFESEVK